MSKIPTHQAVTMPILFSSAMVRAILDGSKTQTRRLSGLDSINADPRWTLTNCSLDEVKGKMCAQFDQPRIFENAWCPYGKVEDRLWVREKWATIRDEDECSIAEITEMNEQGPPSLFFCDTANHTTGKWRPSIHMPRWASRITLEITEVRVQRANDISESDAWDEGIEELSCAFPHWDGDRDYGRKVFAELWNRINGKRPGCSWADSPWVWVISFKVVASRGEMGSHGTSGDSQAKAVTEA